MGYAIVSQEKNKYVIKDIGPVDFDNLDEIFKRVFQMVILFYEAAMQDIFDKQSETIENLRNRDLEVNKFCLYLQRAINKMHYEDPIQARTLFCYSFELEKIGDEIQRLWRTSIKHKIKKTDKIKELVNLSKKSLEMSFDYYYKLNKGKISEIYELREKIRRDSQKLTKLDTQTARFVRHLVKITEDAGDLIHLTLIKNL
jgi:Na+/phosphate symporter